MAVTEAGFAVLAALVVGWAVCSDLLVRANLSGPLLFVVAGYLLGNPDWGVLPVDVATPSVHVLAEVTLALMLFADAARVDVASLRKDLALPVRLLGVGLPLSLISGSLLAAWMLDDVTWALAGFIGATLAPTDAALSAPIVNDERIPMRLRRALNVESGLNDGIVTPVVGFTIALVAIELGEGHGEAAGWSDVVLELALGLGVGLLAGAVSAALVSLGSRRRWVEAGGRRVAVLATALGAFAAALALGGNGFIAAFVAGISFGAVVDRAVTEVEESIELPELIGEVLGLGVWFLFGAALVPVAASHLTATSLGYAMLSLTLVRMLPVALALVGRGLALPSVLFVGWFGPRGLASVVFTLLALEELGPDPAIEQAVAVITLTVVLSVVLHGVTAGPFGRRYRSLGLEVPEPGAPPRARRTAHDGFRAR